MKNIKESKVISILIIAVIYILAAFIALVIAMYFPHKNLILKIFIADICATVFVYIASILFDNTSIYDPYWSVAPIVIVLALITVYKNISFSALLILIAVLIWGLRLTVNWAVFFKNLTKQDWRYDLQKQNTKKLYPLVSFVGIQLMPTLVVFCAMLPAIEVLSTNATSYFSVIGFVVCMIAVALELLADIQMFNYRKRPERKAIINEGLWKYSRHPNYLGEILFWWGIFAVMAAAVPLKSYWIFGAVMNTMLFAFISIPMAEKRLAKREGYVQYKNSTPCIIPFFKIRTKTRVD